MKEKDHHITYSATDIQRYHAGELSAQEQHALEKAALDDPFLADALEGYQYTTTASADLVELQNRLAAKTSAKKKDVVVPLWQRTWLRMTALFLLLAGVGWSVYQFSLSGKKEQPLSKVETTKATDTNTASSNSQLTADSTSGIKDQEAEKIASIPVKTVSPDVQQAPVAKQKEETFIVAGKPTPEAVATSAETEDAAPSSATMNRQRREAVNQASITNNASPSLNTFRGQILDTRGNPVPNASVTIRGSNNGTTTNSNGAFLLTTPDSVVNATVSAVGYESNQLNFNNTKEEKKVVLAESSNALSEVVVVGFSTKKARKGVRVSSAASKELEELEPKEGWSRYNDYLAQNLQIPEEVARKKLTGEVELSFEVNKNGTPINIKVEKSLCTSCDQEAIRLLKEGPGWKKKKAKSGKVKVRF